MEIFIEDLSNGVKLEMIHVPGGTFTMGSERSDSEKPPHEIPRGNQDLEVIP